MKPGWPTTLALRLKAVPTRIAAVSAPLVLESVSVAVMVPVAGLVAAEVPVNWYVNVVALVIVMSKKPLYPAGVAPAIV